MIPVTSISISANREGFDALARINQLIDASSSLEISLDCTNLQWIDAQLGAALLIIVKKAHARGQRVTLKNLSPRVRTILQKNRTLTIARTDVHQTTIPVEVFDTNNEVGFADYTRRRLQRPEMPRMSIDLTRKFYEGIDELFSNAALHSQSEKIVAAGQFYPRLAKLSFIIADGGIGISRRAAMVDNLFRTDADAIEWAMTQGSTTRVGYVPGGLGLKILRSFIRMNGGSIRIASHKGYWEEVNGAPSKRTLRAAFPGTVVSIEILTSDQNSYDLPSSSKSEGIW